MFAFRPDSAVTLTGFTPIDGLELLGISGNEVVLGAEQGVMLSDKGYIGTLNLITGSAGGSFRVGCSSFTVLLGSGDVVLGPSRKKFVDADGEPVYIVKLESYGASTPLTVDFEDFIAFTEAFFTDETDVEWYIFIQSDLNDDGVVNFADFIMFFKSYGKKAKGPAGKPISLID